VYLVDKYMYNKECENRDYLYSQSQPVDLRLGGWMLECRPRPLIYKGVKRPLGPCYEGMQDALLFLSPSRQFSTGTTPLAFLLCLNSGENRADDVLSPLNLVNARFDPECLLLK